MVPLDTKTLYRSKPLEVARILGDRMGTPRSEVPPRLWAWRERMGAGRAMRRVAVAMGRYLVSQERPVPAFMRAF